MAPPFDPVSRRWRESIPMGCQCESTTSPLAVAEFAISELFQSEWNFTATTHSSDLIKWSKIQRERLEKLLGWQQDIVKNSSGSPLTVLKGQKPDRGLFV
jgi:hypothetical protein